MGLLASSQEDWPFCLANSNNNNNVIIIIIIVKVLPFTTLQALLSAVIYVYMLATPNEETGLESLYRSPGPITSWEIDGETVETVSDFILGGSKITVDGDCSHEIKRHSLEGKL